MDAFSYLSVLLSIIIGLAITQILQGYRAILLARSRVRLYFPPLAWSAMIIVMATQSWWSSFGLAGPRDWSFLTFAVILLQMIVLYLIAGVVLPDIPADRPIDLRAHYFREVASLQGLLLAMLAVSVMKDWLLDGALPDRTNLAFHGLFAALAISALVIRRPRYHEILTAFALVWLVAYIGLLFARL